MLVVLIVFEVLIIGAIAWIITTKGLFKNLVRNIDKAASAIEVALAKRYYLLNKMIETTKDYVSELDSFNAIKLHQGMSINDLAISDNEMSKVTTNLLELAQSHPKLQSSQDFIELQKDIKRAQENLQEAIDVYNATVTMYNESLTIFPNRILAKNREPYDFYEVEDYNSEDVK